MGISYKKWIRLSRSDSLLCRTAYGSGRKEITHPVSVRTDEFGNRALLSLYGCESKETFAP